MKCSVRYFLGLHCGNTDPGYAYNSNSSHCNCTTESSETIKLLTSYLLFTPCNSNILWNYTVIVQMTLLCK